MYSFAEILKRMCDARMDTKARNEHPISKLFADKIADLAKVRTYDEYSKAYDACLKEVEKEKP
ncbi:MAG: hypothetical protein ABH950_01200 [Candidatus Altiarchaeota archaeon]